jgi:flagellin-like hook-associated protein FlgL
VFDRAEKAVPATATVMVADTNVDMRDASTLHGKSITIDGYIINFTSDPSLEFPNGWIKCQLPAPGVMSVEEYLKGLTQTDGNFMYLVSDVSVNVDDRTITFSAPLRTLSDYPVTADGNTLRYSVDNGNGTHANSWSVTSNELPRLDKVDGSGAGAVNKSNEFSYAANATSNFTMTFSKVSKDDVARLVEYNTLYANEIYIGYTTDPTDGKNILLDSDGMSSSQMELAIRKALDANGIKITEPLTPVSGTEDSYSVPMAVEVEFSNNNWHSIYIREWSSETDKYENFQINGLNISAYCDTPVTSESPEIWKIELPTPPLAGGTGGMFKIGNWYDYDGTIILYNSNLAAYSTDLDPDRFPFSYTSGAGQFYDINGKTQAEIDEWFYNAALAATNNNYGYYGDAKLVGNDIIVTGNSYDSFLIEVSNASGSIYFHDEESVVTQFFGTGTTSGVYAGFYQDINLTMQMATDGAGNLDIGKLNGTGFKFNDILYEFHTGTRIDNSAVGIDISTLSTADDVAKKIKDELEKALRTSYEQNLTVTAEPGGIFKVTFSRQTMNGDPRSYSPYINYTSGSWKEDGMLTNPGDEPVKETYSGGTDVQKPSTKVDFSSINESNIDTLLGTGFRIACASCLNEYINIVFRKSDDANPMPPEFVLEHPEGNETIKNFAVELDKINKAEDIVKNIVEQLTPRLTHYTSVRYEEDNPTVLIIEDIRPGDLPPVTTDDGREDDQRGSLLSGVVSDFKLTVYNEAIWGDIPNELMHWKMMIQSGASAYEMTPIHLPILSMESLMLLPPEPQLTTQEGANDMLERTKNAGSILRSVRAVIGADHNRLESEYAAQSVYSENLSKTVSFIADADMALEMLALTRSRLVSQSAQAVMSQARQYHERVLGLLQPVS